jgi:Tol biopolymer transport system component
MKPEISRFSLGVSDSGSLYTHARLGGRDIRVATVDFETGKLVSQPVNPAKSFMGFDHTPEWSPDGKYLLYASNRQATGNNRVIAIWSAETGQLREIQPRLNYWEWPQWAPDGRSLIAEGQDLKNRQGAYRIDAQTGEATPIVMSETGRRLANPQWSPDGTRLYYRDRPGTDSFSFVERDLASGNEREIIRRATTNLFYLNLSPDGRFIATTYDDRSSKSFVLLLIPVSGGEPRELLRVSQPQELMATATWMPDGRAVIVDKVLNESGTEREFWLVPTAGGQPRKIDVGTAPGLGPDIRVHPDGRQIAFVAGENKKELWVLENFLPALNAKK